MKESLKQTQGKATGHQAGHDARGWYAHWGCMRPAQGRRPRVTAVNTGLLLGQGLWEPRTQEQPRKTPEKNLPQIPRPQFLLWSLEDSFRRETQQTALLKETKETSDTWLERRWDTP